MPAESDITALAKRRGFYFPSNEPYGGVAGFYTLGPNGAALKRNIEEDWREWFVFREGHMEIQSPTITPEDVFEASGHLEAFNDYIIHCPECNSSFRADHLVEDHTDIDEAEGLEAAELSSLIESNDITCETCGEHFGGEPVHEFNLMFETKIGPTRTSSGYLRPETAQGMFVDFPTFKEYARNRLPFGLAQIGSSYRNEISPRKSLVRLREFTHAELEHFIDPEEDEPELERVEDVELTLYPIDNQQSETTEYVTASPIEALEDDIITSDFIAYYLGISQQWYDRIGIDVDRLRFRQHLPNEQAHYASDCWDAEAEVDGDWIEITGFAYRTDYDLSKHSKHSGDDYTVFKQYDEPKTVERATVDPDMSYLGPKYGNEAEDVVTALEQKVERDRAAFEGEEVLLEVNGNPVSIPTEKTGFSVEETVENGEHIIPHVVEPSFGPERLVYTVLNHSYRTDTIDGEERTYLDLSPVVAPNLVGVFPLVSEPDIEERANEIVSILRDAHLQVFYDDSGNIGRRYRRQDEIGTPFCVTVDHGSVDDDTVTIRERNSTEQKRVSIERLPELLRSLRRGDRSFEGIADASDLR